MLDRFGELDPGRRTPAIFEAVRRGQQGPAGLYAELDRKKLDAGPLPAGRGTTQVARDAFSPSPQGASALARDPVAGPGFPAPAVPLPRVAAPKPIGSNADSLIRGGMPPPPSPSLVNSATADEPTVPAAPPFPVGSVANAPAAVPGLVLEETRDEFVSKLRAESRYQLETRERQLLADTDRNRAAVVRKVETGREMARELAQERAHDGTQEAQLERISTERLQASSRVETRVVEREEDVRQVVDDRRGLLAEGIASDERVEQGADDAGARSDGVEREQFEQAAEQDVLQAARTRAAEGAVTGVRQEVEQRDGARGTDETLAEGRAEATRAERGGDERRAAAREAGRKSDRTPAAGPERSSGAPDPEARAEVLEAAGNTRDAEPAARPKGPAVAYRSSVEREPDSVLDDLYG